MTTTSDILGKPQRIRKLEFLMRYYAETKEQQIEEEGRERYDMLVDSLQREYKFLTGHSYRFQKSSSELFENHTQKHSQRRDDGR